MTTKETQTQGLHERPLPGGWRWVKLGEVCNVVNGFGFPEVLQGRKDLPYPFIKVSDMNAPGSEITIDGAANTVDDEILRKLGAKCYPRGTVIFPKVGGALLTNKKRVLGREASFDNNIMGVIPRNIDDIFLYHLLCNVNFSDYANTQALPSIRQSLVASLDFPLPPLAEQKRIAAVLREQMAAVDKARAAAQARLEAVQALPAALLRQVFPQPGQPLPDGWRWVKLGEVCYEDRQIVEAHSQEAKDLPYLSLEHVEANTGKILREPHSLIEDEGLSTTFRFTPEHVLYGKLRPYLNKVALPHINGRCTTEMIPLRSNGKIIREFLAIVLRRRETVEYAMQGKTGSRMPRADMNHLLALEIPLPPLAEQKRIAAILREQMAAVDKARAAAEAELEAINALLAALLRRAFNGEM